jgi:predicted PurR-regulated permease PerM
LQKVFPDIVNLPSDLSFYAKQTLELLVSNFAVLFSSVAKLFLGVFIFAMSLYYLLKDGNRLRKVFILISPFADSDDEAILQKLHLAVNSVFKGNLTIALVQAVLTALGFAIFGVPNFVLWGTLAGICALIPTVGTSLVLVPGIIYLLLNGLGVQALGLFLWGVFAVGLVDNFLGPRLVGKGIAVHPLLVLFSVLGGISFFGPIGFILGPLFVSLFFALLEIYIGSIKNNINL